MDCPPEHVHGIVRVVIDVFLVSGSRDLSYALAFLEFVASVEANIGRTRMNKLLVWIMADDRPEIALFGVRLVRRMILLDWQWFVSVSHLVYVFLVSSYQLEPCRIEVLIVMESISGQICASDPALQKVFYICLHASLSEDEHIQTLGLQALLKFCQSNVGFVDWLGSEPGFLHMLIDKFSLYSFASRCIALNLLGQLLPRMGQKCISDLIHSMSEDFLCSLCDISISGDSEPAARVIDVLSCILGADTAQVRLLLARSPAFSELIHNAGTTEELTCLLKKVCSQS